MDVLVNDLVLKLGCALDQSEYVLANKELMGVETKKIDFSNILILILSLVLDKGFLGRMFRQSAPAKAGRRLRLYDLIN